MEVRKNGRPKHRTLTGKQLAEVIELFKQTDTVELKVTVRDSDRYSAVRALEIDVLQAEIRQVVFFDTPDLKLNRAGIIVRARRILKDGDTIIKLRPIVPAELPNNLRRSSSFNIEVDVMPGAFVCSGTLKGKTDNGEVNDVLKGERPIRKLFLRDQRALFRQHAPRGVDLDSLKPFGPINVAKLKFSPRELKKRSLTAELWFYPDGSRILELSTKCLADDAFQVLAETRSYLMNRGIDLNGGQQTKTRKALEYFSRLYARNPKAA